MRSLILRLGKQGAPLAKGVVALALLRAIQLSLGFATLYVLVRALSKSDFGEYQLVLNATGIMTIFALNGLDNAVMQAVARGFSGTYRAALPLAFGCSMLGSVLLAATAAWYHHAGGTQTALAFLCAALLFPFSQGLMQWRSIILGRQRFWQLLLHDGIAALITYGLIILSCLLRPGNYWLPVLIVYGIPALQNLLLTMICLRKIPAGAPVEPQNIQYGLTTTFYASLGNLSTHLDRVLLYIFLSPAALATYAAADRIPDVLRASVQDVSAVLAPRFARHSEYTRALDRFLKLFSLAYGFGIVAFAFTLLPALMRFIFGAAYEDAIPYAQALVCSVAVGNLAALQFRYIRSRIDAAGFRNVTLITTLVRLAAFLLLVPLFGLAGVVASMFIYRLALMASVHFAMRQHRSAWAA